MIELPVISIITCTLNSERFLEQTIKSVFSQGYPNLDYWIIDGGSTDGTLNIIKKYGPRIRWKSESDQGVSDAMNKGIQMARGEIVAHLHSDDTYCSGTLLKVGQIFKERPDVKWLIGNYKWMDGQGVVFKNIGLPLYQYNLLKRGNWIGHPSVFIRRSVFEEMGFFNSRLKYAMDYDLWLRIGKRYDPIQITDAIAQFRFHPRSISLSGLFCSIREEYSIRCQISDRVLLDRIRDYLLFQWKLFRCRLRVNIPKLHRWQFPVS